MKKMIFVLFALAAAMPLLASPVDDKDAPVSVGRIQDNVFVSAGAGVNTILDNGFLGKAGLGVDVMAGKWLIPSGAVRIGWHGLSNQAVDTSNGWFAGENAFSFQYAHLDWVWDILNTFKYNPKRVVSPRLGAGGGAIFTSHDGIGNVEFGFGLLAGAAFCITRRLDAFVEVNAVLAREEAYRSAGKIICFPYATAGLTVNIGKTGFDRKVKTVVETVTVPADCGHESQIQDLLRQIDSLKALKAKAPEVVVDYKTRPAIIYFDLDKAVLTRREKAHLEFLMSHLPEGTSLYLTGHADKETGNPRHNLDLSRRRVEAVAKQLRSWGFPAEMLHTDFRGDTANLPYTEDGMQKNRCVYIVVEINE